jgi:hypothetical protein
MNLLIDETSNVPVANSSRQSKSCTSLMIVKVLQQSHQQTGLNMIVDTQSRMVIDLMLSRYVNGGLPYG